MTSSPAQRQALPSLFKNEEQAMRLLAEYLDFLNENHANTLEDNRISFLDHMMRHKVRGADTRSATPEYREAIEFLDKAVTQQGDTCDAGLPSHPDAKILRVYNDNSYRHVFQLSFGELEAKDFRVTYKMSDHAAKGLFYQNKYYINWPEEYRQERTAERRNFLERHKEEEPATLKSRLFKFRENRESPGLFTRISNALERGIDRFSSILTRLVS